MLNYFQTVVFLKSHYKCRVKKTGILIITLSITTTCTLIITFCIALRNVSINSSYSIPFSFCPPLLYEKSNIVCPHDFSLLVFQSYLDLYFQVNLYLNHELTVALSSFVLYLSSNIYIYKDQPLRPLPRPTTPLIPCTHALTSHSQNHSRSQTTWPAPAKQLTTPRMQLANFPFLLNSFN